jgi:hypothetical protein
MVKEWTPLSSSVQFVFTKGGLWQENRRREERVEGEFANLSPSLPGLQWQLTSLLKATFST